MFHENRIPIHSSKQYASRGGLYINLPLVYSESTLGSGGASDTGMCQRFCFGGEKSRLTPPDFNYTLKVFTVRTVQPFVSSIL